MKTLKAEYEQCGMIEKAILARLVVHPEERSFVSLLIEREDFEERANGRLFNAVLLWPAGETESLSIKMHQLFCYVGDSEAAEALLSLAWISYPDSLAEVVCLALTLRDQAAYRKNLRLEEEARTLLFQEENERLELDPQDDDEFPW